MTAAFPQDFRAIYASWYGINDQFLLFFSVAAFWKTVIGPVEHLKVPPIFFICFSSTKMAQCVFSSDRQS